MRLLYPPCCISCQDTHAHDSAYLTCFCKICEKTIVLAKPPKTSGTTKDWAIFNYRGAIKNTLLKWKSQQRWDYGKKLIQYSLHALQKQSNFSLFMSSVDLIVPIPPAFFRTLKRGLHPVDYFAKSVAQEYHKKTHFKALKRIHQSRQTAHNKQDRMEQSKNLFTLHKPNKELKNAHVLIIDDIKTTGATLQAAKMQLKHYGVSKISTLVIAEVI